MLEGLGGFRGGAHVPAHVVLYEVMYVPIRFILGHVRSSFIVIYSVNDHGCAVYFVRHSSSQF